MSPENSLVREFLEVDDHHLQSDLRDTKKSYLHFEMMKKMRRIIDDTNARLVMIQNGRHNGVNKSISVSRRGMSPRTHLRDTNTREKSSLGVSKGSSNSLTNLSSSPFSNRSKSSGDSSSSWMKQRGGERSISGVSSNYEQDFASSPSSGRMSTSLKSHLLTGFKQPHRHSQASSHSQDDSAFQLQLLALENLIHNMYTLETRENADLLSSTYFFERDGKSIIDILSEPSKQEVLMNTADDIMRRISSKELRDIKMENVSPESIVVKSFKSQEMIVGTAHVTLDVDTSDEVSKNTSRSPRYTPKYGMRANTISSIHHSCSAGDETNPSSLSPANLKYDSNNDNSVKMNGQGGEVKKARSGSMNMVFSRR